MSRSNTMPVCPLSRGDLPPDMEIGWSGGGVPVQTNQDYIIFARQAAALAYPYASWYQPRERRPLNMATRPTLALQVPAPTNGSSNHAGVGRHPDSASQLQAPRPQEIPADYPTPLNEAQLAILRSRTYAADPPSHLVCPITYELFEQPATLPSGHTFELSALLRLARENRGVITCPLSRRIYTAANINYSFALREAVATWKDAHDVALIPPPCGPPAN